MTLWLHGLMEIDYITNGTKPRNSWSLPHDLKMENLLTETAGISFGLFGPHGCGIATDVYQQL